MGRIAGRLTIEVERPPVATARRLAPWSAALLALVALAAGWFAWRATFPMELYFNGPWNAWLADLALRPAALYPPRDALTLNNYPPLSFVLLHFISLLPLFPNALYAGRAVSFLSTFAAGAAVYGVARELGAGKSAAAFGGLWFLAFAMQFCVEYVGTCDQNMLGLAAMYGAFYLFLRSDSVVGTLVAFTAMALAGLIKHHLAAAPIAALICLVFSRPWRALWAALFGALVCGALAFLCWSIYGPNFIDQVLAPRAIILRKPLISLMDLQRMILFWPFWFYWLKTSGEPRAKRVTVILTVTSFVIWMVLRLGSGVTVNAELEFAVASGVALSLTVDGLNARRLRFGRWSIPLTALCAYAMIVRVVASPQVFNYAAWFDPSYRAAMNAAAEETKREIARVAAIPGDVSCSVRTVCYLAGKAYVYDPYGVGQMLKTGRATQPEIDAKARAIRFERVSDAAHW